MKEVTEWNGKPRWMWCWDDIVNNRIKRYVVHILTYEESRKFDTYPVITTGLNYHHCSEIEEEEPKMIRMTKYDLAKWLYDGASCGEFREYKDTTLTLPIVFSNYCYNADTANNPCPDSILIRSNCGEWHEPLIEE